VRGHVVETVDLFADGDPLLAAEHTLAQRQRARALGVPHRPPEPILLGRHLLALGLKPGPRIGEILKAVYEQQMDGTVTNLDEAIAVAKTMV